MEKKHSYFRCLVLLVIGVVSIISTHAASVSIQGLTPFAKHNDYPVYLVNTSSITVSSSSGDFDSIYIDGSRVDYNSSSYWSSKTLDISAYLDGELHTLQLKRYSYDYGLCYFTSELSDGILYGISGDVAVVIGASAEIEEANILSAYSKDGVEYPVTSIVASAFKNCTKLHTVAIPSSVTTIGNSAFSGCSALTTLAFNAINCTSCGSSSYPAFPSTISTLTIGEGVTKIPSYFLYNGSEIESVTLPATLTSIGEYAFRNSTKLTSIEIPAGLTTIGNSAFSRCSALTTLAFNAVNCTSCGSSYNPAFPSTISTLTVGEGVTKIPSYFLYNGSEIESVTIPATLTSIGTYAFHDCSKIKSIVIPNAVTTIGSSAFSGCSVLTTLAFNAVNCTSCGSSSYPAFPSTISTLTIGEGVTKIPSYFLYNGSEIESVTFPATLTSIGEYAFRNNAKLISIEIPAALTTIGDSAFSGCSVLTTLAFNAVNCTSFSSSAFPSTISTLTIGEGVTKIPSYFLYNGSEIESVTFPATLTSIGEYAFRNSTKLTSIEIPAGLTTIGNSAFSSCSALTTLAFNAVNCTSCGSSYNPAFPSTISTLTFGEGVTKIPSYFLYNGSEIESVTIPNSVTSIGDYAFYRANNLKSLTLGSGLLSIGNYTFSSNSNSNSGKLQIAKAFWLGNTPPSNCSAVSALVNYVANDQYCFSNQVKYQFLSSKFTVDGTIYVPVSPSERTCDVIDCEYSPHNGDIVISDKVMNRGVELKVLNINAYSYYNNRAISTLGISNNGNIGSSAFYNCDGLTTVTARNNGNIGSSAFYNCDNINNVALGDSVTAIGERAFYRCPSLPTISLPNNISSIGEYIFYGCSNLASVNIGTGMTAIPEYSFANCSVLNNLTIPGNVNTVGDYAFSGCKALANLTIADSEDEGTAMILGSNDSNPLFSDCPLSEVYIGRKLSYNSGADYGYSPFYRNTSLQNVEITDAETQIYDNEFYGCTNLKTLKIGNGVTSIGKWAFSGCSSLDYFSAGYHVETIGDEAFSDCTGITNYYSFSINPPVCGNQALDDINKWECTLFVPAESSDEYMVADQWKDFFFVNENDAVLIESIRFDSERIDGKTGDTFQLVAEIVPGNATRRRLEWTSSDPNVVTVDATGILTFVKEGYATITARTTDGSGKEASINVVVTVKVPELGDSNANGVVNIADAVNTANYAIGNEVEHFNATAADVNIDGIITLADASATVTLILEQPVATPSVAKTRLLANATIDDLLVMDDFSANVGETASLFVALENTLDYVALQADITVPEGMSLETVKIGNRAEANHSLIVKRVDDRTMRVALFDLNNAVFADNNEAMLELIVKVNKNVSGNIEVNNIIASDSRAREHKLAFTGGNNTNTTGIGIINTDYIIIETGVDGINILNAEGCEISIYSVDGSILAHFVALSDFENHRAIPGIYIVTVADKVEKVMVK